MGFPLFQENTLYLIARLHPKSTFWYMTLIPSLDPVPLLVVCNGNISTEAYQDSEQYHHVAYCHRC